MNYSHGPGLQVIYSSDWSTEQALSSTNPTVISLPFKLATATGCSVQIVSDGGAAINYLFQVTNFPTSFINLGYRVLGESQRDETVNSVYWDTTPNGSGSIPATRGLTTLLFDTSIFREGRIVFSQSSGSGKIFACLGTAE